MKNTKGSKGKGSGKDSKANRSARNRTYTTGSVNTRMNVGYDNDDIHIGNNISK